MNSDKRNLVILIFMLFIRLSIFSASGNSTQIIQSGHWIYDAMEILSTDSKRSYFLTNQPLTVGELKFYLNDISWESLSDSGKILYDKVFSFLTRHDDFFPDYEMRVFANLRVNPEFYWKTNSDIPWSFSYNYKDFAITLPILLGFSDYFTIESDLFLGKNYVAASEPYNFTNIPLGGNQIEFLMPRFAYGSTGVVFEKWGVSLHVGKEGLQIGNTLLGSVIYNKTFETDSYIQLSLYTNWLKYALDVIQVDHTKFMYIHQLDLRPFKNFTVGVVEGSLLNSSFELRYLNPLMIMHQFGSWTDYDLTDIEARFYGEGHFCAYLGFTFEWTPVRHLRVYGMYAQNEILDFGGSRTDSALSVPDSIGAQFGAQYNIPLNHGFLKTYVEAVYTSPYLYIKQSPDWSLYRHRQDMQTRSYIDTWLGSPLGPDCFAIGFKTEYESSGKWKSGAGYVFKVHGENNARLFSLYDDELGIYQYYPWTKYQLAENDDGRLSARDEARNMWMSGIPEYINMISLFGGYSVLSNLEISAQFIYTFIFNNGNVKGRYAHGAEFSLAVTYQLFK